MLECNILMLPPYLRNYLVYWYWRILESNILILPPYLRIYLVFALLTDNPRIKIAPGLDRPLLNNPSF